MVVGYLDVIGVPIYPAKAASPLVIDADAVLTLAGPQQPFKAVARRHPQILKRLGCVENRHFPLGDALDIRWEAP